MIKLDIAHRYAKVLFNLDSHKENLMQKIKNLDEIVRQVKINKSIMPFLRSPQIALIEKKGFLERSFAPLLDPALLQFLIYLISKNRIEYLEAVANNYRKLINDHFGVWEAELITPVPIERSLEDKLIRKIEQCFEKKIRVKGSLQPSIIGGAILLLSNTMIDWSITNRLKKMKEHLQLLERKNDI